jgi:hypothetical protein
VALWEASVERLKVPRCLADLARRRPHVGYAAADQTRAYQLSMGGISVNSPGYGNYARTALMDVDAGVSLPTSLATTSRAIRTGRLRRIMKRCRPACQPPLELLRQHLAWRTPRAAAIAITTWWLTRLHQCLRSRVVEIGFRGNARLKWALLIHEVDACRNRQSRSCLVDSHIPAATLSQS